ncbi:MAG TPA: hypothetical protein VLC52_04430, partial [Anaerolineae bacterium]|nr:hypothetical protein [Anaerolineae bacterium]
SAGAIGLSVDAGGSTIAGLIINRFAGVGILLNTGGGSSVTCNYIGTDPTGTVSLGNLHGVYIDDSANNTIGGATEASRNLVSGNDGTGVRIEGSTATGNLVQGNYVGLTADGTTRLDNGLSGVYIAGAPNNTVGGTTEASRNVISGNTYSGVSIYDSGAAGNIVQGNYIGTQANGTETLYNTWSGIYIVDAPNNVIGGTTAGARNIISGNGFFGVSILGGGATGNLVHGNYIGTGTGGTENLGNGRHGIVIWYGASDNHVGGPSENESNLIAYNGGAGVYVESGINNIITQNSALSNAGLGIDLGPDGATLNDTGDVDSGANNLQNSPVLTAVAISSAEGTVIQGTLHSTADTIFHLEFFYSGASDPTGYGEGEFFFGSQDVTTDGSGNASFTASFPTPIPGGSYVAATATDPANNTSEFSEAFLAPTAVRLLDFRAQAVNRSIQLEWSTATETDNLGFNIYRAEVPDQPESRFNEALILSQMPGSPLGATYTWLDEQVEPGVTYYYWLEDMDVYGTATEHGPVFALVPGHWYYLPLVNQ